jgi:hypothetical protein
MRGVDEMIDEYRQSKDFVESVINENKALSVEKKAQLQSQIKQIMANIFRLKNPTAAPGLSNQNTPAST